MCTGFLSLIAMSFFFSVATHCVLSPLVHIYGTGCHHIYATVIVSYNLNGCSRLICLVLETAALCDISVRSAVYKSSYFSAVTKMMLTRMYEYFSATLSTSWVLHDSLLHSLSSMRFISKADNRTAVYAFNLQPQSITAPWLVLIDHPTEGRRLSWCG